MARIVKEIVNDFDDKRVRVLFHESDLLKYCLLLTVIQKFHRKHRPFDSEHSLVILPGGSENSGEAALSDQVVLVRLVGVGVIALLGNAK